MNKDGSKNLNHDQQPLEEAYRSFILRIQRRDKGWEIQLSNLQSGHEVKFHCPNELLEHLRGIFQAE